MWGQALNTQTSPLPAEEQGGGPGVGRWRVGWPSPSSAGGRRGQVQRPVLTATWPPPNLLGEMGRGSPKIRPLPPPPTRPSPHQFPPCPRGSTCDTYLPRFTHTHTHVVGDFGFCFLKNMYIKNKKKRYIRNRGRRRRDIANVRSGGEGVGDRRREGAGAAEKREGQRAGCR